MDRKTLINSYIDFFKKKGHKEIPNSSLIPENDPTVLFTTAGMHPLIPFLTGQKHPQGKRLVGIQRCIRTGDIELVGDSTHHTFFEMLGNWSLDSYGKKQAIEYSFEFLTKTLKIKTEKLAVSCFIGDKDSPKDEESAKIWKSLGIKKIKFLGKKENWWGPAGKIGPCGPDTEIFVNGIEIWNDVLMEYYKDENGNYNSAKQKNIDTGMGVERTITILNGLEDNYETEVWKPIIEKIEQISKKKYSQNKKEMRIIADHIKAATFIISDGIIPSNTEQGYVLRRLIRKATRYAKKLNIKDSLSPLVDSIIKIYPEYKLKKNKIIEEIKKEEKKFLKTLEKGLRMFEKMCKDKRIDGKESFLLYQSYGFPVEMIEELSKEKKIKFNIKDFNNELKKHQKLSQTASAGKFKSGLADHSEETTKLHTASHLLLAALQKVLDKSIHQRGSNINPERLRFDFSIDRKLTDEEKKKVEELVIKEIKKNHKITREEMNPKEAKEKGASGIFDKKYGDKISVYTIGNFSKEICTGPHVNNTSELGKFKIIKEESSSSGVRRIRAVLE